MISTMNNPPHPPRADNTKDVENGKSLEIPIGKPIPVIQGTAPKNLDRTEFEKEPPAAIRSDLRKVLRNYVDKARERNRLARKKSPLQQNPHIDYPLDDDDIREIADRVEQVRAETVDTDIAELLFELKDEFLERAEKLPETLEKALVDAVCIKVLADEETPGEIDEREAKWLLWCMLRNGKIDDVDIRILDTLKAKSINYPDYLVVKTKRQQAIDRWLYRSRFFSGLAMVGSLLAAFVLFITSTANLILRAIANLGNFGFDEQSTDEIVLSFVACVDNYLFAMVLLIFGVGIYELFINQRGIEDQKRNHSPAWLRINSIDDLKASLGKSILMVLIVALYKHALEFGKNEFSQGEALTLLGFAGVIVLVAVALHLTHSHHEAATGSPNSAKQKDQTQRQEKENGNG